MLLVPDSNQLITLREHKEGEAAVRQLKLAWEKVQTCEHISADLARQLYSISASISSFLAKLSH